MSLKVGDIVTAKVSQLCGYGAWVEWPDHQALVLIVDMATGTKDPGDFVKLGQEVTVRITRHDGLHTRAVIV